MDITINPGAVNANETANEAKVSTPSVAKKNRRGITNETKSVSQLKFTEKDATANGLFVGHLEEVKLTWVTFRDGVNSAFAGNAIPRLNFHFTSNHTNPDERRHVYKDFMPIESNVDTIPGGSSEWRVNALFAWIKHILSIYVFKNRPMTEVEEDALTLDFEDFDENNEFIALPIEDIINGYKKLFENVEAIMNGTFNLADGGTAKPAYLDAKGNGIPVYMKLLRYVKNRNNDWTEVGSGQSKGELAFPATVGEGVIEVLKGNNPPSILRVNVIKESITPKETKKMPNLPGVSAPGATIGGGYPGSVSVPSGNAFTAPAFGAGDGAFQAAGEEMPF
jgi:hypothetical protein